MVNLMEPSHVVLHFESPRTRRPRVRIKDHTNLTLWDSNLSYNETLSSHIYLSSKQRWE